MRLPRWLQSSTPPKKTSVGLTARERENVKLVNPRAITARDLENGRVGHQAFGP